MHQNYTTMLFKRILCEKKVQCQLGHLCQLFASRCAIELPVTMASPKPIYTGAKRYSRFSANTILTGSDIIKFTDYDCIGFDLDNTLLRYNLFEMVELEYRVLAKYLVTVKGYSSQHLYKPMRQNIDFLQRGLIIDFVRGNILKIAFDGYISKASHGTRQLTDGEIVATYGPKRKWDVATGFCVDLLQAWHGSLSKDMRTLLDYFDMPASLVFARIVDTLDEQKGNGKPLPAYNIWPDILDGLCEIFTREHFENDRSDYFASVKANPTKYIRKTSEVVRRWLENLKKERTVFLLTGSHIDFANLTASHALGVDWREYFDIVICFAKKPGFFTMSRPFMQLNGIVETNHVVDPRAMKLGGIYSQGNWRDLMLCLSQKTNTLDPKVLYVGDNLIQDVYAPNDYCKADTIAIAEEMLAEGMRGRDESHCDKELLTSPFWGTYFFSTNDEPSIWLEIIRKHSKLCVPTVECLAAQPLDHPFKCFGEKMCVNGFYPSEPKCFSK